MDKKSLRELELMAKKYGFSTDWKISKSGHLKFKKGEKMVVVASTPSDFRFLKNTEKFFKRNSTG